MRYFHKFLRLHYANTANNRYLCGVLRKILESVWLLSRKSESGKFTTHGITRLNAHVMRGRYLLCVGFTRTSITAS